MGGGKSFLGGNFKETWRRKIVLNQAIYAFNEDYPLFFLTIFYFPPYNLRLTGHTLVRGFLSVAFVSFAVRGAFVFSAFIPSRARSAGGRNRSFRRRYLLAS